MTTQGATSSTWSHTCLSQSSSCRQFLISFQTCAVTSKSASRSCSAAAASSSVAILPCHSSSES